MDRTILTLAVVAGLAAGGYFVWQHLQRPPVARVEGADIVQRNALGAEVTRLNPTTQQLILESTPALMLSIPGGTSGSGAGG